MANLKDVARLAGVSTSTASRVLREEGYSSQEVREKVERAAETLHYVPNTLARSMRGRLTRMISFLVYDIVNPFFANLAAGIEDAAHEHGFTVVVCSSHPWQGSGRERSYMQMLVEHQIDGIVLQHRFSTPEYYYDLLRRQEIPIAAVVSPQEGFPCDLVRCDTTLASRDMVNHLLSLGHRRIAAIGPKMPSTLGGERLNGYMQAMAAAGLETNGLVLLEGWRTRDGYNMTHHLLDQTMPDAFFAFGPRIAAGCANALRERGLRIPEDVALACVDDFGIGSELDPFMTVVKQPEREMGKCVGEMLIDRILERYTGEPRELILPAEIVIRRSCGAQIKAKMEANIDQVDSTVIGRIAHHWEDD
jgi:LacI family transcriptional regulator